MAKEFPILDAAATGARIKMLRKERKLTVAEVAQYMGFGSDQAVYKWQRGESLPTLDNIYALSALFGTSVDYILCGSKEEDEKSSSFDFMGFFYRIISDIIYNIFAVRVKIENFTVCGTGY